MSIQIGNIKSIGKSESFAKNPDDRQELVKLVDGALAVDGWGGIRRDSGDTVSLTATFNKTDADQVITWWHSRTKQNVVLEDGTPIENARIIVRRISFSDALKFRPKFTILDLEFWRV